MTPCYGIPAQPTFSRLPTIDDSLSQGSPPSLPLLVVSLQPELEAFSLEPTPIAAAASLSLPRSVGFLSDLFAFLWALSNRTTGPIIDEACKHSTLSSARLTAACMASHPVLWLPGTTPFIFPLVSLAPPQPPSPPFPGDAIGITSDSGFPEIRR